MNSYTIILNLKELFISFLTLSQIYLNLKILLELILYLNAHVLAGTSLTIDFSRL